MKQHEIKAVEAFHSWGVLAHRVVIWPLIGLSYASVITAIIHWVTDTWSGLATLAALFTVALGVPTLFGNAGYLWRKGLHRKFRWETALCAALPCAVLLLALAVIAFGRFA